MILISACLCGIHCRYDGAHNLISECRALYMNHNAIIVCPEIMGGLSTPRCPCEIQDGDGSDVLKKRARVITAAGVDCSDAFIKGAQLTSALAKRYKVNLAVFKSHSPSCGVRCIYDGSFSRTLRTGSGVTAALLQAQNIQVITETDFINHKERFTFASR